MFPLLRSRWRLLLLSGAAFLVVSAGALRADDGAFRREEYFQLPWLATREGDRFPKPNYPIALRKARLQASVALRLFVGTEGTIDHVEIVEVAGDRPLADHAAKFARRNWRAMPRTLGDEPMKYVLIVPVTFSIDGGRDRLNAKIRARHSLLLPEIGAPGEPQKRPKRPAPSKKPEPVT